MLSFFNKFRWFSIGAFIAWIVLPAVVYAVNVTVPQSTQKGAWLSGLLSGNYQVNAPCSNGQILAASSTSSSGWACVVNTAALGATTTITSNIQISGPDFTFSTNTHASLLQTITGSGSTLTFSLQPNTGYTIPLSASTTNWNGLYDNLYSRLIVSTSSSGTLFYVSTSSPGTLSINYPANVLSTTTAAATYEPILTKGNLTATSPLQFDNTRQVIGGAAAISVASGYAIPTTASSTGWDTAHALRHAAVTLAGENYLSLSGQQITAGAITLSGSNVTGVLPIANGGTGTSTAVAASQLLVGNGTSYDYTTLPSCSNSTTSKLLYNTTTRTFTCGTDQSGAGGSTTTITSNIQADGPNFTFATGTMTGLNLNITGSGSTVTFSPVLQSGYVIPLSASTTEWHNFHTTPSGRITAGNNLTWSGNQIDVDDVFPTYTYASSTFPSFTYASSSYFTLFNTVAGSNIVITTSTALKTIAVSLTPTFTSVNTTDASTTNLTIAGSLYDSYSSRGALGEVLQSTATSTKWVATSTLGISGSLSGGTNGYAARWTSGSTLAASKWIDNGTVVGFTATSSAHDVTIRQSDSAHDPFQIMDSTGAGLMVFTGAGAPNGGLGVSMGLGTSTPAARLHVVGSAGNNPPFQISSSTGTSILQITAGSEVIINTSAKLRIPIASSPSLTTGGQIAINTRDASSTSISFHDSTLQKYITDEFLLGYLDIEYSSSTNLTNNESLPLPTVPATTTITRIICYNYGATNDKMPFNLVWDNSPFTATSSATSKAFTTIQNCTGTSTPQTFQPSGSTTINSLQALRLITGIASSTKFHITVYGRRNQ